MARLRAPGGCPWDREQSFDTIKPYLLEESYEVMDAIDARDWEGLAEELGDLLLQPVFFAQMAAEEGRFDIADSLDAINSKLIRRHPHVFGEGEARTADDVKRRWDEIKAAEKPRPKGTARRRSARAAGAGGGAADRLARGGRGVRLGERRAGVREAGRRVGRTARGGERGRDRERNRRSAVRDREPRALHESGSRAGAAQDQREVPPRFAHVETGLAARGKTPRESTIEEMEALWQDAKRHD